MSVRLVGTSSAAVLVVAACVTFLSSRPCACPSEAAAAIGSLRAITSAQQVYASACGSGGFAIDLADLAAPSSPGAAGFISPDFDHNGVVKGNYRVTLSEDAAPRFSASTQRTATCSGATRRVFDSYFASATPVGDPAGRPFFATDARGVIYQSSRPITNPITPGPDVVRLR